MLLGLRRRKKRLPPRPDVPTGLDDFCGMVLNGQPKTFNDLAERKRAQMGDYDYVTRAQRLRYQKMRDPNYTEKK